MNFLFHFLYCVIFLAQTNSLSCENPILQFADAIESLEPGELWGPYCKDILSGSQCCSSDYFINLQGYLNEITFPHRRYFIDLMTDIDLFIDNVHKIQKLEVPLNLGEEEFVEESTLNLLKNKRDEFAESRVSCYETLWNHHASMMCLACTTDYSSFLDVYSDELTLNLNIEMESEFINDCYQHINAFEQLEAWAIHYNNIANNLYTGNVNATEEFDLINKYLENSYDLLECGFYTNCQSLLENTLKYNGLDLEFMNPNVPVFEIAAKNLDSLFLTIKNSNRLLSTELPQHNIKKMPALVGIEGIIHAKRNLNIGGYETKTKLTEIATLNTFILGINVTVMKLELYLAMFLLQFSYVCSIIYFIL